MTITPIGPLFDGETFDTELDEVRIASLLGRVFVCMSDHKWHTLKAIQAAAGGTEAGVSARLRDLRKERFGSHRIDRRREAEGLHVYRLVE